MITSGVGPTEARRFVVQLAARLEALAEQRGLAVCEVISSGSGGDDGPPRSMTLRLRGEVLAALAGELGSHVLISPSRGRAARKRWFAAVSLHASAPDESRDAPEVPRDELVITACRAGGPGGQHVNKVSSAVRVHHVPSGIAIRSAGARSQHANLVQALRRLAALLRDRAEAATATARAARRSTHYTLERGRAVRSYQLDAAGALVERHAP